VNGVERRAPVTATSHPESDRWQTGKGVRVSTAFHHEQPPCTVAAWRAPETPPEPRILEQQVFSTGRLIVLRCEYRPESKFEPHQHPQEQVTIVESGVLELRVGGRELRVRAGEMIAIPAGIRHSTLVGADAPVRVLNLFVNDQVPSGASGGCVRLSSPLH